MLSIIVPVYNVERYLHECLESLRNQTYEDYEVVVVNDGSKDNSGRIAEEFCKSDPRFFYFEKENGGLMSAWMYGIEKTHGEYIGFVDSDDILDRNMYEKLMNTIIATDADIVMCGRKGLTKQGLSDTFFPDLPKAYYSGQEMSYIHDRVFPSLKGGNISSARWNKLYKRNVIFPNLKYCECRSRFCEDRYIVPACLLTAKSFAYVAEPLYYYRMRKSANSKKASPALADSLNQLTDIQMQMLRDKGVYDRYIGKLEEAQLDYIKLVYERNVMAKCSFSEKMRYAHSILDSEKRKLILAHWKDCKNKFGKCLLIAAKLQMPIILVLAAYVLSINSKIEMNDWFE